MLRTLVFVLIGSVAGGVATYLSTMPDSSGSLVRESLTASDGSEAARRVAATATVSVSSKLTALQAAQSRVSVADLAAELESLQRRPWSAMRDIETDALLMRLAELSPRDAAQTALRLDLEPHLVAQVFLVWAEESAESALAALGTIENPAALNDVAIVMLDLVGDDPQGFERIAAYLPAYSADVLRVEWLAQRAKSNPYDAFRIATSLRSQAQSQRALVAVATAWAGVDPRGAMQHADSLPVDTAQRFRLALSQEWARLNSSDFLAFVETASVIPEEFVVALRNIAIGDPERMLQLADRVPPAMRDSITIAAIGELARTDFARAESLVLSMSPGQMRNQALSSVGGVLAQEDPEEALRWAQEVAPSARDVIINIAMNIASNDIDMALELIDNPPPGLEPQLLLSIVSSRVIQDAEQAEELAEKFLRRDDLQSQAALSQFVSNWMQTQPVAALDWVLNNNAALDVRIMSTAASGLANRDVETAVAYIDRIPQEHREAWITQVAGQYGRQDPAAALSWVAQYQGQPFYDRVFRQTLQSAAQVDPRTAAQMLSQASETVQLGAAQQIAMQWSQTEPRAALEWGSELTSEEARTQAVSVALNAWANTDLRGASQWTLSQPRGEQRDQTLRTLLSRGISSGIVDDELISGFSSERQKQQALMSVIPMLARTDAARARELLDEHITDGNMRQQGERMLEQRPGPNGGLFTGN